MGTGVEDGEGSALLGRLSPRQREILELVAKGLTNPEIGGVLQLSTSTVRAHVVAILARLAVTNRTEAAGILLAARASVETIRAVLARPAIAVLPFVALPNDGDEAAVRGLAGGLAHDLASLFARWSWFPVIASASTRAVRAADDTSVAIGQRLGARFLVDGTIRADGRRVRLAVHIDDAETGFCVWAGKYDFAPDALFAVQDEVCEAIVAAAYPVLATRSLLDVRRTPHPGDLQAWELAHDGMRLHAGHEANANRDAEARFEAAIARAPDLVLAHYGLGLNSYDAVLNQWTPPDAGRERLRLCAERCIELSPHAAEGYHLLGRYHQTRGDPESAVRVLETAIAHNPSFAVAHALLAQLLQLAGRSDPALERMRHAIRLSPRAFVAGLATLHFMRGEYAQALAAAEQVAAANPHYTYAHALAAASAWWLGERAQAARHMRILRERHPQFAPGRFLATFGSQLPAVERMALAIDQISTYERSRRIEQPD